MEFYFLVLIVLIFKGGTGADQLIRSIIKEMEMLKERNRNVSDLIPGWKLHILHVPTVNGFSPGNPVSLKSLKTHAQQPERGQLVCVGSKGFQNMGFSTPLTH